MFLFLIVVRALNTKSPLLGFQVYNTVLLTVGMVLYGRSPELKHLA